MAGKTACGGCPKYLNEPDVDYDEQGVRRVKHIMRIDSMIKVGCTMGPNDLSQSEWNDLIILASERSRMEDKVAKRQRDNATGGAGDNAQIDQTKVEQARKDAGIPSPGQSLFGGKR